MPKTKRYYIAYGSNLHVSQMRFRCPEARIIGTGMLENWELLFKGSKTGSYLTIEPKHGSKVPIALWEVTEQDEQYLDRYEGYPNFYYKKDLSVTVKGIRSGRLRKRDAFVYIMREERPIGIPTMRYLQTCAEGYRQFGFDIHYLFAAYEKSKEAYYENH